MTYETLDETEWDSVDQVWDLLNEGRTGSARDAIEVLLARRPGHPDLRVVDAAGKRHIDDGEELAVYQSLPGIYSREILGWQADQIPDIK